MVSVQVGDDVRRPRRHLGEEAVRIALIDDMPAAMLHGELVVRARANARNEQFPHAGRDVLPHLVAAAIPHVEVADHGDASAFGAQTAKFTPATPSTVRSCAPSFS